MSEVINKAARALEGCDPSAGAKYEDAARAVLLTIREPTDRMQMTFLVEMAKHSSFKRAYTAMMDEALVV